MRAIPCSANPCCYLHYRTTVHYTTTNRATAALNASLSIPFPLSEESNSIVGLRTTKSVKGPVYIRLRVDRKESSMGEVTSTKWVEVEVWR